MFCLCFQFFFPVGLLKRKRATSSGVWGGGRAQPQKMATENQAKYTRRERCTHEQRECDRSDAQEIQFSVLYPIVSEVSNSSHLNCRSRCLEKKVWSKWKRKTNHVSNEIHFIKSFFKLFFRINLHLPTENSNNRKKERKKKQKQLFCARK